MPVNLVHSRWASGSLIFHEANNYGAAANLFTIAPDAITVGSATNDVNFSWLGSSTGTFDLDAGAHTLAMTGLALSCDGAVTFTSTLAVTGEVTLSTHLNLGDYDAINFGAAAPDVALRWHGTGGYMQMYPLATGVEMQWGQVGLVFHQRILTTGELRFRDDALKIYSPVDARLDIVSDNYLYLTATGVLIDNGYLMMAGSNKIYFRHDIYIHSGTDSRLDIYSDGTAYNAIQITTGGGSSGVHMEAMLALHTTGALGDTNGQVWYNTNTNKFCGYENGAVKTFTTS